MWNLIESSRLRPPGVTGRGCISMRPYPARVIAKA